MGGAERVRLKRNLDLQESAKKCKKLDLFVKKVEEVHSEPTATGNQEKELTELPSTSSSTEAQSQNIQISLNQVSENVLEKNDQTAKCSCPQPENQLNEGISNSISDFDYFKIPDASTRSKFCKFHPQQPQTGEFRNWNKTFLNKNKNRKWLTYSNEKKALYCFVCMAYGNADGRNAKNVFIRGFTDFKHHYDRIKEHEISHEHSTNAEAFFLDENNASVRHLLQNESLNLRKQQIQFKRDVLRRVIDVIKCIGKCGLSYRGNRNEAAYLLENPELDRGNFLEMLLLLRKYDPILSSHLDKAIADSKKSKDMGNKKRTGFVTLISKTTVNYIIIAIKTLMQKMISDEIRKAGMFSVQVDTTEDEAVKEQCAIVIRYVKDGEIKERLIDIIECDSTTGKNICELFKQVLLDNKIDVKNCIGSATDGAANMQGAYNGFTAWLQKETVVLHVWCYAHVLNLFVIDITKKISPAINLFGLLNEISTFFKDSYQRINIWRKFIEKKMPTKMNETRWNSKYASLEKIFGKFNNSEKSLYIPLIKALLEIENDNHFSADARFKACNLKENLLKFETILTSQIYLRIFEISSPLSKYLQSCGIDFMKCNDLVNHFKKKVMSFSRDFETVKRSAEKFANEKNFIMEAEEIDAAIETNLPVKRIKKRKKMADENSEVPSTSDGNALLKPRDEYEMYKIDTYNVILDTAVTSINERFNDSMYRTFAYLDPKNFSEISDESLPVELLQPLSDVLQKFDEEATPQNLKIQLLHFIENWDTLKKKLSERDSIADQKYSMLESSDSDLEEDEGDEKDSDTNDNDVRFQKCVSCQNCVICCFLVLEKYSLLTTAYSVIGLAYKYLVTQSVTEVACERSFSKLRYIKNRLRTTIGQNLLSSFMLMSIEKGILSNIDSDEVIDIVANRSKLMTKLLSF